MHTRIDSSPALLELASLQSGVLSTAQVAGLGLPRRSVDRLLDAGRWQQLGRGLYVIHDQPPVWTAKAWGGILLGGPEARLGGLAAAHLHELGDPPSRIDILVPLSSQVRQREPWRFIREQPGFRSPRSSGRPPRLPIEDAVLDLTEKRTEGQVADLVSKAVQSRRTTAERLAKCAAGRSRLRHRKLLLQLLADVGEGAESPLELRFLRDVERPHGLPRGARQQKPGYGNVRHDVRYEAYRLVVELDGRIGHEGIERFRDMDRDNAALVSGEATMRYGWRDAVERPCPMAFQIGSVLVQRGWPERPNRCPRCRDVPDVDMV